MEIKYYSVVENILHYYIEHNVDIRWSVCGPHVVYRYIFIDCLNY